MDLQHKELTEKIIGAAFEVYNALVVTHKSKANALASPR
jgi:hypothetical protein